MTAVSLRTVALLIAFAVIGAFIAVHGDDPAPAAEVKIDFDADSVGKVPAGFTTAVTGDGDKGKWEVREDDTAPSRPRVLAQTSTDSTDMRFPLCVCDATSAKDVTVSVRFKAVSGSVDQAAGLVVRYQDKDNYYVTRANALENNVRLYRVVKGQRKQFAGKAATVAAGEWHTLKISIAGNHFAVSLDNTPLFEADDETFSEAGKVGLWTKADSVTLFDDLKIAAGGGK